MISALLPNYARADLAFERGEGAWLWTVDGRRLLDFGSGIATASLGHGHPHLAEAIAEQAAKVMHVSNLYRIPQAERLAQRLVDATFADSVFFCNSGAEANEGMIKMMRRAMFDAGKPERFRFICFEGAFHGRTLATLAATGNAKYLEGFGPVVEGFDQVPFNNMNAVRNAIGPATAGIIVEPIQGEGGVRPADMQFLRDLRAVCDEYGLILGMDEVQSGMGRTGKLFAHEWAGITPDVMSAAKGIGGGFPLGAVLAKEQFAKALKPGTHGTTFGGNPLACAAGNAVLDIILAPGFLEEVERKGRSCAPNWTRSPANIRRFRGRARHGPVAGPEMRAAAGRGAGRLRRRGPDGDHRRRERAASGAAAGGDRRGPGRGRRDAAPRDAARAAFERQGSSEMSASLRRTERSEGQSADEGLGPRHFLDLRDFDPATLRQMLDVAANYKRGGVSSRPLAGKTLALIFEKPSTRTRVSFEVGMRQLGGDVVVLSARDMQSGRGETPADTARVLSRYVDAIMLRTDDVAKLHELAEYATVPVINGLTDTSHPCQLMADVLTFEEHRGPIAGQVVAWCGDGNNVARSWIEAAVRFGFTLRLATPDALRPPAELIEWARAQGGRIELTDDPEKAVAGARCVVTDTWVSMSDDPNTNRHNMLAPYRVTSALMAKAAADALFMHCLPAHRGEEVTAEVIDGPQSVVFDEAENRLHAQKGVLAWVLGAVR